MIKIKIGIIGLGRMGKNLALNIAEKEHDVFVFNRTKERTDELVKENNNIIGTYSLEELRDKLDTPRIIWLMVPCGKPVDEILDKLTALLNKGDIIIDGGNSFYKDSIKRYNELKEKGIEFLDIGTSGGIEGARNGACYMVGGKKEIFSVVEPILKSSAIKGGYGYMGPAGSGHLVKMVHNGIEYGMMQSIGEGFEVLKQYNPEFNFKEISEVWSNGSIISSYLMDLTKRMFSNDPTLDNLSTEIGQSGEGLWTLKTALDLHVSIPSITASIFKRFDTKKPTDFSSKVIQGLRSEFGGHDTKNRI